MTNGVLRKCTICRREKNCCCHFDEIDFPILSDKEKSLIIEKYGVKPEHFSAVKNNCFNIVARDGICPFYTGECNIYNDRPNDCKLFPFDIKKINQKYYLILYKLNCFDTLDMQEENVDDIVEAIKPYIDTYTNSELNKKVNLKSYYIIKEIII